MHLLDTKVSGGKLVYPGWHLVQGHGDFKEFANPTGGVELTGWDNAEALGWQISDMGWHDVL